MNLADIRKKAQTTQAQAVPAPPQGSPPPEWQAPSAPVEPAQPEGTDAATGAVEWQEPASVASLLDGYDV
ncbi:MAG TPA: hypothetical protein VIK40_11075, partial [Geomonas sp.]